METWAVVALTLGAAAITGLVSVIVTRKHIRHNERLFAKQLEAQEKRERRQRRIEVRSGQLLAFRTQLASMATYMHLQVQAHQLERIQLTVEGGVRHEDELDDFVQRAANEESFYIQTKKFREALAQVDDAEIQKVALNALSKYTDAYGMDWGKSTSEALAECSRLRDEADQAVTGVQSLINTRLEGFWSEDRD